MNNNSTGTAKMFICALSGVTANTNFKRFGFRNDKFSIVARPENGKYHVTIHQKDGPVTIKGDTVSMKMNLGGGYETASMALKEYIEMEKTPIPKLDLPKFGEISLSSVKAEFPKERSPTSVQFHFGFPLEFCKLNFTRIEMSFYHDRLKVRSTMTEEIPGIIWRSRVHCFRGEWEMYLERKDDVLFYIRGCDMNVKSVEVYNFTVTSRSYSEGKEYVVYDNHQLVFVAPKSVSDYVNWK